MDGYDLTPSQKIEMIQTVYGLMESNIDQIFGQHPVQQCREYNAVNNLRNESCAIDSKLSVKKSFSHSANVRKPVKRKASVCPNNNAL